MITKKMGAERADPTPAPISEPSLTFLISDALLAAMPGTLERKAD